VLSKQLKSGIPQRREAMRSIGNASIGAISPRIFIWEGRSIRTRNGVGVPPHPSALVRIVVAIDSSGSSNEDWVEDLGGRGLGAAGGEVPAPAHQGNYRRGRTSQGCSFAGA